MCVWSHKAEQNKERNDWEDNESERDAQEMCKVEVFSDM